MAARIGLQCGAVLTLLAGVLMVVAARPSAAQPERLGGLQPPDLLELHGHIGKPFPDDTGYRRLGSTNLFLTGIVLADAPSAAPQAAPTP